VASVDSMTPRVDAFGVVVADLAASRAFYRRLGIEIPEDPEQIGHVETTLPGGLRLMFDTVDMVRTFNPSWQPPTGGHRIAVAFACADAAEVDSLHDELVAAGAPSEVSPFDAPWGQRYATVHDPDGNPVDLFADLPAG
jgi:uncharacterized glyoxalase superfamily protein PhnB